MKPDQQVTLETYKLQLIHNLLNPDTVHGPVCCVLMDS